MIYLLIILGVIVLFTIVMVNVLVSSRNRVNEAFSTMDVYLKKRWDLIPNIVETVKGYATHEKDTLESVISMRNTDYDKMSKNDKLKSNEQLKENISKLIMLKESYPDLKANENFNKLSSELSEAEDEIANSRKYYNAVVRLYNNKVEMFPGNIIAKIFGFKVSKMFEASDSEKNNIRVEL